MLMKTKQFKKSIGLLSEQISKFIYKNYQNDNSFQAIDVKYNSNLTIATLYYQTNE